MSPEEVYGSKRRSDQNKEGGSKKKTPPYFDPSIPNEPLLSDEDTAVNSTNVEKKI